MSMHTSTKDYTNMIGEEQRKKEIINFIRYNHGCSPEEAFQGVKNKMARSTFFKLLISLKGDQEIIAVNANKRDHKLYVNSSNPLISVPRELDEFENYFYPLLDRSKEKLEKYLSSGQDKVTVYYDILGDTFLLFSELVRIYNYRALLIWPKQIKDSGTLDRLYVIVFSKLKEIQVEIINRIGSLIPNSEESFLGAIGKDLLIFFPETSHRLLDGFRKSGMEKEAKPVLDYLSKNSKDIYRHQVMFTEFFNKL
jgi:hypothetical protein